MRPNSVWMLCQRCGCPLLVQQYLIDMGKGKYCSRFCAIEARRPDILTFVDRSGGDDACWPWLGYCEKHGYGRVERDGERELAHRAVYKKLAGPIDEDVDLLHHCDNPPCCNPKHLFEGTHLDNMRDMVAKGRHRPRGVTPLAASVKKAA